MARRRGVPVAGSYAYDYNKLMSTNCLKHAETRSIGIAAPPSTVLELVGDARRLPEWAPGFAPSVRRDGEDWVIGAGEDELRIRVRVSPGFGTVDFLRPGNDREGSFGRVIPNADGCEFLFTLLFPDGTGPEAIDAQMTVVDQELRVIRALCEA